MSYFTHLECSVPCGADAYDPRVEQHLCTCGAPLLARYDLDAARAWTKASLTGREPNMWRYRELMPLFDGEQPLTLGEGWTPLIHAQAPRRRARARAAVRQGRIAQSDQLLQGARPRGRGDAGRAPGRAHPVDPLGRQRRQRHGGLRRRGRDRGEGLHAEGREGPVHPRVRAVRRRRQARRRPDHRRRPRSPPRRASRSAGTTSRR